MKKFRSDVLLINISDTLVVLVYVFDTCFYFQALERQSAAAAKAEAEEEDEGAMRPEETKVS